MPIIKWKDDFQVGIQEIDRHHEQLVQALNANYDQFREGLQPDVTFLQELVEYSTLHFQSEEKWMERISYPDLAAHKEEHDLFRDKMCDLRRNDHDNAKLCVELLWFLCNWVTHHFETDAEFGTFMEKRGRRQSGLKRA